MVLQEKFAGPLRKVVFHHGHKGPQEIGVSKYFLNWLTDPFLNGGGALVDFGCYGVNLMTALTKGEKAVSVTAVTRQFKPDIYPEVDDEATIIISYPESQCIIQASWNWPFSRKDMEIYGSEGLIIAQNANSMQFRNKSMKSAQIKNITENDVKVYTNPFEYFADVINNKIEIQSYSVYSLENNIRVVEILDAARKSAEKGRTIYLN
jgi:predicted dehydrogenase